MEDIRKGTEGFIIDSNHEGIPYLREVTVSQVRDNGRRIACGTVYSVARKDFYTDGEEAILAFEKALEKAIEAKEEQIKELRRLLALLNPLT